MIDFEKSTFFYHDVIFHTVREVPRVIFDVTYVDAGGRKNRKSFQKFKIMLESCKETSKFSVDIFLET